LAVGASEAPTTTSALQNPGNTKNCSDFGDSDDPTSWEDAQAWFDQYHAAFGDPAKLDSDANGIACESYLPDCSVFAGNDAQAWFERNVAEHGDVANLDGDDDGKVCE
jgi:hypothetical protein